MGKCELFHVPLQHHEKLAQFSFAIRGAASAFDTIAQVGFYKLFRERFDGASGGN